MTYKGTAWIQVRTRFNPPHPTPTSHPTPTFQPRLGCNNVQASMQSQLVEKTAAAAIARNAEKTAQAKHADAEHKVSSQSVTARCLTASYVTTTPPTSPTHSTDLLNHDPHPHCQGGRSQA